ncbi:hypothetical protein QBC35DRAFT_455398 [Podospora australis]|uniref:Uncharacterized protein n=1 Tax=Podospora australis TaxID=1536484 RepID=A0AAN6WN10_9PEZI|nr:hypothetical protein QBC35DRAFT_455398 [Podospora australis]
MALLFPDFGSWLFRSARRDTFAEKSPILTIERLILASRPIGDADKDALVGAVLTMGSSLHQALGLILELLPEDKAGDSERLGEIVCPTLGQLLASLQTTLSAFECPPAGNKTSSTSVRPLRRLKHSRSESALRHTRHSGGLIRGPPLPSPRPLTPILVKKKTPPQTPGSTQGSYYGLGERTSVAASSPARFHNSPYHYHRRKDTETFPPLLQDDIPTPRGQPSTPSSIRESGSSNDLVKALQSELRVQSAIKVAVESLEFAERQLQLVKEINRIHGGSFELMQKQFYSGYNTLLMRALELERNELMHHQAEQPVLPPTRQLQPAPNVNGGVQRQKSSMGHQRQQPSIHVSFPSNMPTPPSTSPRAPVRATTNGNNSDTDQEQPRMTRRNTIQGIREEGDRNFTKPALKRRLSLAEELALAGDDDDTTEDDRSSDSGVSDTDEPPSETESTVYNTGIEASERSETESESQNDDSDDDESEEIDDVDDDDDDDAGVLSSSSSNEISTTYGHDGNGADSDIDGSKVPRVRVEPLS